jgi:hypothetical protein
MTPFHAALLFVLSFQDSPPRIDCRQWQECRQLALDASARQDYETFHDLAWRAVQTGPKNDSDLLYLLARAQSLSGRPGDALVMLQRLARMGVRTDAATSEDFRRVRALPAWPETEALLKDGGRVEERSAPADPPAAAKLRTPPSGDAAPKTGKNPAKPAEPSTVLTPPEAIVEPAAEPAVAPAESLRFTAPSFTPAGIAYDAVSRRFIVGDRDARKLAVVDEFSHHVANLASAQSTGFGDITALEIDVRQGTLWVVSNDSARDEAGGKATLHKLQLVSGRLLASYAVPERLGAARFADVATAPDGTVIVLDTAGQRLLRLAPRAKALEVAAAVPGSPATSVAPGQLGLVYVATGEGILAVDLSSRASTPLKVSKGVAIGGITRIRWFNGSLIALQQSRSAHRAVRIALGRNGRIASALEVLDASLSTSDPTAATVSGGTLYYLASGDGAEMIVRKVALK